MIITNTELFHMVQLKHALALEIKGLKLSRGSAYAYIKKHYGLRGNRKSVHTQFCELVEKAKGEVTPDE